MKTFDIKSLQIWPPHLSDVATLPWEIQKGIFNNTTNTHLWLFALSQNKTNCNCYSTAQLFTYLIDGDSQVGDSQVVHPKSLKSVNAW